MWDVFFSGAAIWFTIPALVGTGLFLLKLILMLAGGDHGHDAGVDGHDFGGGHDADLHILSVQGVLAFLMGFGWVGLLVLSSTSAELILAGAAGLIAGGAAMYGMAKAMAGLKRLQSSGTVDVRAAIGSEATVYVTIPEAGKGAGQVMLVVGQKQRIYNAVSSGPALARNAKVRVLTVQGHNTLAVEPA